VIGYGIACLIVCLLSAFDRRAMPFAITILSGWLVGYMTTWGEDGGAILKAWMTISTVSALVLYGFSRLDHEAHRSSPQRRWFVVTAIAVAMLCLDVIFAAYRARGVDIAPQHSKALDVGLIAQLVLIGQRGAINAGAVFWRRLPRHLFRRRVAAVPAASRKKEAAE
jgi:hypothetical protein